MKDHLQAIATLFPLINPMVCAMMFVSLSSGRSPAQKIVDATRVILMIAAVLVVAAFLGARILHVFGISLDAFSVAGGLVLSFIGFQMLVGPSNQAVSAVEEGALDTASYAPMILFAASPGTITGVITTAAVHSGTKFPTSALVAIATVLALTWVVLMIVARATASGDRTGPSLGRDMITRYMGLIVIAMGIQYALTGYKAFMGL